jgi:hypothetical protein
MQFFIVGFSSSGGRILAHLKRGGSHQGSRVVFLVESLIIISRLFPFGSNTPPLCGVIVLGYESSYQKKS